MADVKITLKKSPIGCKKPQIKLAERRSACIRSAIQPLSPIMHKQRAKLEKIIHLVEVIKG